MENDFLKVRGLTLDNFCRSFMIHANFYEIIHDIK